MAKQKSHLPKRCNSWDVHRARPVASPLSSQSETVGTTGTVRPVVDQNIAECFELFRTDACDRFCDHNCEDVGKQVLAHWSRGKQAAFCDKCGCRCLMNGDLVSVDFIYSKHPNIEQGDSKEDVVSTTTNCVAVAQIPLSNPGMGENVVFSGAVISSLGSEISKCDLPLVPMTTPIDAPVVGATIAVGCAQSDSPIVSNIGCSPLGSSGDTEAKSDNWHGLKLVSTGMDCVLPAIGDGSTLNVAFADDGVHHGYVCTKQELAAAFETQDGVATFSDDVVATDLRLEVAGDQRIVSNRSVELINSPLHLVKVKRVISDARYHLSKGVDHVVKAGAGSVIAATCNLAKGALSFVERAASFLPVVGHPTMLGHIHDNVNNAVSLAQDLSQFVPILNSIRNVYWEDKHNELIYSPALLAIMLDAVSEHSTFNSNVALAGTRLRNSAASLNLPGELHTAIICGTKIVFRAALTRIHPNCRAGE